MYLLEDNVEKIKGIGSKKAQAFSAMGIETVKDLIYYFPKRYSSYTLCNSPEEIERDGAYIFPIVYDGRAVVKRSYNSTKYTEWTILLNGGKRLQMLWFNQPYISKSLEKNVKYTVKASVELEINTVKIINPVFTKEAGEALSTADNGQYFEPVYTSGAILKSSQIGKTVREVFSEGCEVKETLPPDILEKYSLAPLGDALRMIHMPQTADQHNKALERFVFDELFTLGLRIELSKAKRAMQSGCGISVDTQKMNDFTSSLGYTLTNGQKNALDAILKDLGEEKPMNRLLHGDVGCGKTVVALGACYGVSTAGGQSVIMVPTEVLARQHFESASRVLAPLGVRVGLLCGKMQRSARENTKKAIASGEINVLIATHAVISDDVSFKNLTLAVTDEQHRFGVKQRARVLAKGEGVNMLAMSATPIPRTLSLTLFGDMDISEISELPPGRTPIKTYYVNTSMSQRISNFVRTRIESGEQAYIICPMIDEDDGEKASVNEVYTRFALKTFKGISVGMMHSRMSKEDKEEVMAKFAAGQIKILVSTTVIEVGVNVPNATVMVIENAERFGLSQLHQLRGRVGRGDKKAYCILVTDSENKRTIERMRVLSSTTNGFEIAQRDLEMRGAGERFGLKQHGDGLFKYARLPRDTDFLSDIRATVEALLRDDERLKQIDFNYPEDIINILN
ncbi:MAG: ATP-dependent DNA helicase RecG [Clostridiales bacterium]|nr:ATP-dependent DNA helicase RecG [Clostridiales bacterium]